MFPGPLRPIPFPRPRAPWYARPAIVTGAIAAAAVGLIDLVIYAGLLP